MQVLEGDITASRILGFHLADPFVFLQTIAASGEVAINLFIGAATILLFYALIAGRAFCSWVCPYGLLGEFGGILNDYLVSKKIIKKRSFDGRIKWIFLAFWLGLAYGSGWLVFEAFSVVGIVSRAVIYGYLAALWWVILIFLAEIFIAKRFWCQNVCAIGAVYSIFGRFAAFKLTWNKEKCTNCGECLKKCIAPEMIIDTKKSSGSKTGDFLIKSGDCIMCFGCMEVCEENAINLKNRIIGK